MSDLRYEDFTYRLRGCIFQIRRELKTGWSEEEYHQALLQLLRNQDVPVMSKLRKTISHRDIPVHTFECDLLDIQYGLIANFGKRQLQIYSVNNR